MENMKHEVDKIEEHDRLKHEARLLKCRAAQLDDSKKKVRLGAFCDPLTHTTHVELPLELLSVKAGCTEWMAQ